MGSADGAANDDGARVASAADDARVIGAGDAVIGAVDIIDIIEVTGTFASSARAAAAVSHATVKVVSTSNARSKRDRGTSRVVWISFAPKRKLSPCGWGLKRPESFSLPEKRAPAGGLLRIPTEARATLAARLSLAVGGSAP
jgi:hypothetical protein